MVGHGHAEPDGVIYFAYLFLQSDARRGRLPKISGLRAKMSNKKWHSDMRVGYGGAKCAHGPPTALKFYLEFSRPEYIPHGDLTRR